MAIPIENIYYLLSYAWNKLDEKDRIAVAIDDKTELVDLFAKILINSTKILLKRGIDKSYINNADEIYGVKGKLELTETVKRQLLFKQKTICTYDEFSANILSNQILITTLSRLTRIKKLDKTLRAELGNLQRMFIGIDFVELKSTLFKKVNIHRNNNFYGFIISVCQIIYANTLPSEQPGELKFIDFTRDPHQMNQLFEAFIRNFYKREQSLFKSIKKETIRWQFSTSDISNFQYLPDMETDITLENDERKIIIDAKFYKDTLVTHYGNERIHSSNLYQLYSYLMNQRTTGIKNMKTSGILLYPTIEKEYDISFKYEGHDIYIRTINLDQNWKGISKRLKEIIDLNVNAQILQ